MRLGWTLRHAAGSTMQPAATTPTTTMPMTMMMTMGGMMRGSSWWAASSSPSSARRLSSPCLARPHCSLRRRRVNIRTLRGTRRRTRRLQGGARSRGGRGPDAVAQGRGMPELYVSSLHSRAYIQSTAGRPCPLPFTETFVTSMVTSRPACAMMLSAVWSKNSFRDVGPSCRCSTAA